MLGFYSIRKLIEAKKLSDSVVNKCITVKSHEWKGNPVTKMNWGDIDNYIILILHNQSLKA